MISWKATAFLAGLASFVAFTGTVYYLGGNAREASLRQAAAEARSENIDKAREIENEVRTDDDLRRYFDQRMQVDD